MLVGAGPSTGPQKERAPSWTSMTRLPRKTCPDPESGPNGRTGPGELGGLIDVDPCIEDSKRYGTTVMSAPTPAPGDESPREGYYPDPSIPGYVRYWNGASWVPGTSRPAPRQDGTTPATPPAPAADAAPQRQAPVDETGPMYLDEVEGTDAPAPDGGSAGGEADVTPEGLCRRPPGRPTPPVRPASAANATTASRGAAGIRVRPRRPSPNPGHRPPPRRPPPPLPRPPPRPPIRGSPAPRTRRAVPCPACGTATTR